MPRSTGRSDCPFAARAKASADCCTLFGRCRPISHRSTRRPSRPSVRRTSRASALICLKEMLRTIPKHKGTEHIQADIKSRIKQFTDELIGPRKGPARVGSAHSVHREGAAQVGLIGPPNSGKSSLHALLTVRSRDRPVSVHDAARRCRACCLRGHRVPARGSAADVIRTHGTMDGGVAAVGRCGMARRRSRRSRMCRALARNSHRAGAAQDHADRSLARPQRRPRLSACFTSRTRRSAQRRGGPRPVPGSAPRTPRREQERSRPRPQRGAGA